MADDPVVAAWRGLLVAHSRLVPAVEGDLRAAGQQALRKAWPVYREAIHQRLGARLTPEQCRELAALLDLAVAGSDIALPGQSGP